MCCIVDLSLSRRVNTVMVGSVAPGVYKRLTFNIHKPEDSEAVADPVFREGSRGDQRFSAVVVGRVEGEPFVHDLRESIRQRVTFSTPLLLGAGDEVVVVTLQAGVDAWVVDAEGHALDSRFEDDAGALADAVKASFRAPGNEDGA